MKKLAASQKRADERARVELEKAQGRPSARTTAREPVAQNTSDEDEGEEVDEEWNGRNSTGLTNSRRPARQDDCGGGIGSDRVGGRGSAHLVKTPNTKITSFSRESEGYRARDESERDRGDKWERGRDHDEDRDRKTSPPSRRIGGGGRAANSAISASASPGRKGASASRRRAEREGRDTDEASVVEDSARPPTPKFLVSAKNWLGVKSPRRI